MQKVELHPAFWFDCDECGRVNFSREMTAELCDEERQELRDEFGIQPWEEGEFTVRPKEVVCQFCSAKFETEWEE